MCIRDSTTAAPAWILEQVAIDLIASGETTHLWLGVVIADYESASPADSVIIEAVVAGSPAADAGLQPGDKINSMNGEATPDAATLHQLIQGAEPGDDAELLVTRDGDRNLVVATLAELDHG